jgi:putative membrane protein
MYGLQFGGKPMKRIIAAVCCFSLCAIPALAKSGNTAKTAMSDQQFVDFAAQTDMVECNLGKLAADVAASQPVKDYGQMLNTDHSKNLQQLKEVAQQAGFTVPYAIDAQNNHTLIGPFHQLKGVAFDRRFVPTMVKGHTEAIAIFKKEAADAQNAALRSYAQDTVPVLEKHLHDAEALEKGKTKK